MVLLSSGTRVQLHGEEGLSRFGAGARQLGDAAFTVEGDVAQFGDVQVADLTIGGFSFDPSFGESRMFPTDGYIRVFIVLDGTIRVSVEGSTYIFMGGTAAVIPCGQAPAVECATACRILRVMIRPERLGENPPERLVAVSSRVVRREPALDFLAHTVRSAQQRAISAHPTSEVIARLIGRLVTADQESEESRLSGRTATLLKSGKSPQRALDAIGRARLATLLEHLSADGHVASAHDLATRCSFATVAEADAVTRNAYGLSLSDLIESQRPVTKTG